MNTTQIIGIAGIVLLFSCTNIREAKEEENSYPPIFPDYTDVAVPCNIAPLNFEVKDAHYVKVDFQVDGETKLTVTANDGAIDIPQKEWHALLEKAKGTILNTVVSTWDDIHPKGVRYKPFGIRIAEDAIDKWIAYRLIDPGYEGWNQMGIYQRDLTSFVEKELVSNSGNKASCINCHSFAGYASDKMMFHIRGAKSGTVIYQDGKLTKIDLKQIGPRKNGVYPMWHPDGRYIVFSSNDTHQTFFSQGDKPIEVYDLESDLILYDTQTQQVLTDPRFTTKDEWETFPAWTPDGKTLYFCSASAKEMPMQYKQLHYHLLKVDFDKTTGRFNQRVDTVYNAEAGEGCSISFPRISPDGQYLLYTKADCATFPIWHKEADLEMIRLADNSQVDVSVLNSDDTESYHAWSSSGRWILFSSRRIDGRYTRIFIAYMDKSGKIHKPFLLPQKLPISNLWRLKSYNIPEFIKEEVVLPKAQLESLF